jgi:hypothetical protein
MNDVIGKPVPRHLILGAALMLAIAASLLPRTAAVHAQEPSRTPAPPAVPARPAVPAPAATPAKPGVTVEKDGRTTTITSIGKDGTKTITIDKSGPVADPDMDAADSLDIGIGPGRSGKKVHVHGLGADREYDSFGDFIHNEPWIAGMVIAIIAIVFLSPVLAIGLILAYRMRKARMMNETMLKLAQSGAVAPAEAMAAIAGGMPASAITSGPATGPIYEHAKQIRKRAAWSDLRKGVIMTAIGIAWTAWAAGDGDGSPNWLGLVFLFVGIGYIVLWWFEERQLAPAAATIGGPAATGAPPDAKSGGA